MRVLLFFVLLAGAGCLGHGDLSTPTLDLRIGTNAGVNESSGPYTTWIFADLVNNGTTTASVAAGCDAWTMEVFTTDDRAVASKQPSCSQTALAVPLSAGEHTRAQVEFSPSKYGSQEPGIYHARARWTAINPATHMRANWSFRWENDEITPV